MREFLLDILICPSCQGRFSVVSDSRVNGEIETGKLSCACGREYPIRNGIPRFVESDKYVGNFSFEWNRLLLEKIGDLLSKFSLDIAELDEELITEVKNVSIF